MKKLSETKFFSGLERHSNVPDKVVAILLAFIPILQYYKGLMGLIVAPILSEILPTYYVDRADNMAISLMILLAPYLLLRLLPRLKKENFKRMLPMLPLLLFFVFKVVDHGTSVAELIQVGLMLGYLIAAGLGALNLKVLVKTVSVVAAVVGLCTVLQYIGYYGFGVHLRMVPVKLLIPAADQWIPVVTDGLHSVTGRYTGYYRPSAFFLEPNHLFLYCFPALFLNLYRREKNWFNWVVAALSTVGIVLSTSSMGVAVVFGAWVLFALLWDRKTDSLSLGSLLRWQRWVRMACVALALLVLFLAVPSINHSIARIVGLNKIEISAPAPDPDPDPDPPDSLEDFLNDKNAVSGRVTGALGILKNMTWGQWIIGCADSTGGIASHMPGFMSIAYKYGIIGLVLSYAFFLYCLKKVNADYFWYVVIWFFASFFSTHTHGMIFMLFYVMVLCRGCQEADGSWQKELRKTFRFLTFRKPE